MSCAPQHKKEPPVLLRGSELSIVTCVNRERGLQMQARSLPSAALVPGSTLSPRDRRGRGDGAGSCPARAAGLQGAFVCPLRALTQAGGAVLAESPFETCGSVSGRERRGQYLACLLSLSPSPASSPFCTISASLVAVVPGKVCKWVRAVRLVLGPDSQACHCFCPSLLFAWQEPAGT